MPRRYRRRRYYPIVKSLKSTKYSNETYASAIVWTSNVVGQRASYACPVIPTIPSGTLGTRKVKNFSLKLHALPTTITDSSQNVTTLPARHIFVLVFVPEGTNPSLPQIGALNQPVSLYEPNQNVILSGIIDSTQVYSSKTRLARNLNAGDQIVLILYNLDSVQVQGDSMSAQVDFTCNYAVAF